MSEKRSPPEPTSTDASPAGGGTKLLAEMDISKLWDRFKSGAIVRCPKDEASLALAVDGATKSYRLVCTKCGNASLWFETTSGALQVRSTEDSSGPGDGD